MDYLILEFERYIYPARAMGFILSGFLIGKVFIAGAVCALKHCFDISKQ